MRKSNRLAAWCLAAAGVCVLASPAPAFYWLGWPSNPGTTISRTVVPPGTEIPGPPVAEPKVPGGEPIPPEGPPPTEPPPNPPGPVPEPATAVVGLIGLGVLAARRLRRGK
jgi:hypothetical protein